MIDQIEFWLAAVSTFGNLSDADFINVYSKQDIVKTNLEERMRCVEEFSELSPGIVPYDLASLFEEGDKGAHDSYGEVSQSLAGATSKKK